MRAVRALAVLAGLAVVGWLVWEVGPGRLLGELRRLSWRLGILMLPQALVSVLDAAGWGTTFPGRRPGLVPLVTMRLAGEAVNDTTPTGTLGGDALKAWLAERVGVPLREGLVSVVVTKTALIASQALFLGLGWALLSAQPEPRPALRTGLAILTAGALVASGGFLWAQQHGLFRVGSRPLQWLGLGAWATGAAARLDADLACFYRGRRGCLAAAIALHLAGWMAGALEVWLALRYLGTPVSAATALVVEAGATGIRSAGFLVPASIGIQESGLVGIFAALGLGAPLGLTFGMVRRIREAVWTLAGYACLATRRRARAAILEPRA